MTPKPNPFSIYDFLGYFTPGATALYIFNFYVFPTDSVLKPALSTIAKAVSLEKPASLIPFVLLAYLLGHLLSFLSSVTVERYYLWVFGYPSKELLRRVLLQGPPEYFSSGESPRQHLVVASVVAAFLIPISALDWLLRVPLCLGPVFEKKLDKLLATLIHQKMSTLLVKVGAITDPNELGKPVEHDFFRFVYHFAVEHAPNHLPKMQNYVALYGLLRTMCFLGIVVFWWTALSAGDWSNGLLHLAMVLLAISLVSYIFFLSFMKFYRRFTLEAFMAMAVSFKHEA